jgi:heptosyltransferase I
MTEPPLRFLIVRLSSIGDIVHALPAAAALAETFPQAQIDWVVENLHAPLLAGNPCLRRVVALDTLGWRQHLASASTWREVKHGLAALREGPYHVAFDFQGLWKSAVTAWLSGAPERIGFADRCLREPSAAALYTQRVPLRNAMHVVEENLALVNRAGARTQQWRFPLPRNREDDRLVEARLAEMGASGFVIVNPGGGWRTKCWPPEDYARLIRRWEDARSEPVLVTGSPAEEPLIRDILRSANAERARYFPSTVVQFIALARRARLFIGGDTGPLHLAAAVGTPIVGIYGPTDPARNGPFARDDITLWNGGMIDHTRRGANLSYLSGIGVDSVMAASMKRLERADG